MEIQIQIRNLSKTYANGVHGLKGVTLTIPRHVRAARSEWRRQVLMRMIAALQEPDQPPGRADPSSASDPLRWRERCSGQPVAANG
jgi:hypothetical protein